MKISVIIPTYKPQEYLWGCLDSIVLQTFPREYFELILVLNGCDEPYKTNICRYIKTKMHGINVNFIHVKEPGVSNARNIALERVKGEYVAFIDDDDYVSPRYLELLYEKASPNTVALCYPFAFKDKEPEKQLVYRITEEYNLRISRGKQSYIRARKFFSGPCMKLISMQIIKNRRFDVNFVRGEDSIFMFLISDRIKYIDFTSEDAVYYRRFRMNSAVTTKQGMLKIIRNSCNMMIEETKIYLNKPMKYNLIFYLTRLLGCIKTIIVSF